MIATMKPLKENMYNAAKRGFINATDLADYLTKRGVPFRSAYKTVGEIVAHCIGAGCVLDNMPLDEYKKYSDVFAEDLYTEISLEACVKKRISAGSTGYDSVEIQLQNLKKYLNKKGK